MNLNIYTSNMKVCLIFSIFVVYFVSCYGALNVTEELMFLKETALLQKERIDGLQQTVGDILQRNEQSVPSDTPQLPDITQREDDVLVEKSSKWIKKTNYFLVSDSYYNNQVPVKGHNLNYCLFYLFIYLHLDCRQFMLLICPPKHD